MNVKHDRFLHLFLWLSLMTLLQSGNVFAQPMVVATAEGEIGSNPGPGDLVIGSRFESIRGLPGDILLAGMRISPDSPLPFTEMNFLTDQIHGDPNPLLVDSLLPLFDLGNVDRLPPGSARMHNAADDGDWVAFGFAADGPVPDTMSISIRVFDEQGNSLSGSQFVTDNSFQFPDPAFSDVGVAADDQGRVTVVYTDFPSGSPPAVRAQRLDGATGAVLDPEFLIDDLGNDMTVALLDPSGDRLLVAFGDSNIKGRLIDFSGATPVVLPEFPISTTPANFGNLNPAVAADPETGAATVVWENISGDAGNPVDLRARRFDAAGNPVGDDFRVNTTTANDQGQPAVAYGQQSLSAVVWAGSSSVAEDVLDTFLQVYDAQGQPIGGEIRVNTETTGVQDRPSVRFMPEPDNQGRPQVTVVWRDVGNTDGSMPNGTGTRYKCFSIDGLEDPESTIFADGFESGDTSSWSDSSL